MKLHVHSQSKTCSNKKSQNTDQSVALLSVRLFSWQVAGVFNLCGKSINICTTLSPRNFLNKSPLNVAQCLSVVYKHCHTSWGCTETCIQYSLPPLLLSPPPPPNKKQNPPCPLQTQQSPPSTADLLSTMHRPVKQIQWKASDVWNKWRETHGEKSIQKHNLEEKIHVEDGLGTIPAVYFPCMFEATLAVPGNML